MFNCGFISDPLSKCMVKNCMPGDPFSSQRVHNSSFNMLYPGADHTEESTAHILQPIDVGLRGEHYLDSEMEETRNQHTHSPYNLHQPQILDEKAKALLSDGACKDLVVGQGRTVQRVSSKKRHRTSDLRKYLNHAISTNVDASSKASHLKAAPSTAFSSKIGFGQFETDGPRHSQSCYDSKFQNPSFNEQPRIESTKMPKDRRIEKYNQMLKLIDLKHTSGPIVQTKAAFDGSFLPPPSENSQNLYSESPLKKLGQPQFEKRELPHRPVQDAAQGVQSEVSPDSHLFKQVVQNSSQIKNKFDRQTIINNFFNLQTTEVHLRNTNTDYSKSAASKAS